MSRTGRSPSRVYGRFGSSPCKNVLALSAVRPLKCDLTDILEFRLSNTGRGVSGDILPFWRRSVVIGVKSRRPSAYTALIAAIKGTMPMMAMTRLRLYARTCNAISVRTFFSVFIWKWV